MSSSYFFKQTVIDSFSFVTETATRIDFSIIIFVCVVVLGTFLYGWLSEKSSEKIKIPSEWIAAGTVAKMFIYPMETGGKVELHQAECTKQCLMEAEKFNKYLRLRDRSFSAFHSSNSEYRNSQHYPKIELIDIESRDMDCVAFKAPGISDLILQVPARDKNKKRIIKHWENEEEVSVVDCGENAARWISNYVLGNNVGLRLGYHDVNFERTQLNNLYKEEKRKHNISLRNESSGLNTNLTVISILSRASVAEVNEIIDSTVTSEDNFRPNLVVEGQIPQFSQKDWKWIKIGNIILKNVVECMRCSVTVDMQTGLRRVDGEPLRFMEKFCKSKGTKKVPVMGILVQVHRDGLISVDDTVYIGKI